MALTLDGTATARAAAGVAGAHWLLELDFTSGTLYFTTWPLTVVISGNTYLGLGNLLDVSTVGESEDTAADQVTLALNVVNTALLASAIGDATFYRGRAVRLYLQLFDDTYQPVGARVQRWTGTMEKVSVSRTPSPATGGSSSGKIELRCSRSGMSRARNATGLRLTHAQQQQRFPGDMGLEYIQPLIETPALWLSKKFQEV
jgi:hypothetical protein